MGCGMNSVNFHFRDALNYFMTPARKGTAFEFPFNENPSVKHLIEALGVPHTEVSAICVNGEQVQFGYRVQHGDRIEVHPASQLDGVHPEPEPRFVLDNHLGQLATYLRMLGFDTLYRNDYQDDELAQVTAQQGRILLTRDRHLLMRKVVVYGYCIRNLDPRKQVREVVRRYGLLDKIAPFERCLRCNHPLQPVSKESVLDRLEPLTKLYYEEFHLCPACNQVYWKGSHYEGMQGLIEALTREGNYDGK
jgi:uncharacterized protein with PIN domain/sulfur carrier protein ThiS